MQSKSPHPADITVNEPVGAAWLIQAYELALVQPLAIQSQIGKRRHTIRNGDDVKEVYQDQMRPPATLAGNLTFMLKHEGVSLELLARLYDRIDPGELVEWFLSEPTGQYARRACFLYEWIRGGRLDIEVAATSGNYVDALDSKRTLVAAESTFDGRWRVRDNMPGTRNFCPLVRLTDAARNAMSFDCRAALQKEEVAFGADTLVRSAVWMTLRESLSSFQIEGEQDQVSRVRRFAAVMESHVGQGAVPLDDESLAELQRAILGPVTTLARLGIRRSEVFVGQTVHDNQVVHYVAPHSSQLPGMLDGLSTFLHRTAGGSPIARAAIASFGFVYLHPLADGNGRVHRFLVNDVLRRDGAVPSPFILPISALITENTAERGAYDSILEVFSKPLMGRFGERCEFSREGRVESDGVTSNFNFAAHEDAQPAWRFPDLTSHVVYLGGLVERTIHQEMHQQADFFRNHGKARLAVKDIIEGPDTDIDAIIRSVLANGQRLSAKLAKQFPQLQDAGIWVNVVAAVQTAFAPDQDELTADEAENWDRPIG